MRSRTDVSVIASSDDGVTDELVEAPVATRLWTHRKTDWLNALDVYGIGFLGLVALFAIPLLAGPLFRVGATLLVLILLFVS